MLSIARIARTALAIVLLLAPASGSAQPKDPAEVVQTIKALTQFQSQIETLYRLTEEIVFWQSVAIMGGEYGWTFSYNTQGSDPQAWTLRLLNALDETRTEAIQASQAISRNKSVINADRAAGAQIFAQHQELREIAERVYALLLEGRARDAADVFETESVPLRREIAGATYSASAQIRDQIDALALDVRLGR